MIQNELITYRTALAQGYISEAEQDFSTKRWSSCVKLSQLAVESAGNSVLALFGILGRIDDPAQEIAAMLRKRDFAPDIEKHVLGLLPWLLALGPREHYLAENGDESTHTPPWDLFDEDSATEALEAARASVEGAKEVIAAVEAWRNERSPDRP